MGEADIIWIHCDVVSLFYLSEYGPCVQVVPDAPAGVGLRIPLAGTPKLFAHLLVTLSDMKRAL